MIHREETRLFDADRAQFVSFNVPWAAIAEGRRVHTL